MQDQRRPSLRTLGSPACVFAAAMAMAVTFVHAGETIEVRLGPTTTVVEREGITGAGWAVVLQLDGKRTVELIYPNHPDDFGATTGTGRCRSLDDGATWTQTEDDQPIAHMVDLWQDRMADGSLAAVGLRHLPDPKLRAFADGADSPPDASVIGRSTDEGRTWKFANFVIRCSPETGIIARPLPHLVADRNGTWLMPAYAWSRSGNSAVLLQSIDHGRQWDVRGTIATVAAIRESGVNVTTPWLETAVARTADGSWQAIIRTGSSEQAALVTARSGDDGRTWSSIEAIGVGPDRTPVVGKLPNLLLLPNGVLTLLTSHTKLGCRLYVSADGTGRTWSEAHVVSSISGGNTSLVGLDDETVLVFMPSSKRISCRRVAVCRTAAD